MTNLETLEKTVEYTNLMYINKYKNLVEIGALTKEKLERETLKHSSNFLFQILNFSPEIYEDIHEYTLKQEITSLSHDGIKTELLKNIVEVAVYNKLTDTSAGKRSGNILTGDLTDDEIAVILFNNLIDYGIEKVFELFKMPIILSSVCRSFVNYKTKEKKEVIKNIVSDNSAVIYINNEIDLYYKAFGNKKNKISDIY